MGLLLKSPAFPPVKPWVKQQEPPPVCVNAEVKSKQIPAVSVVAEGRSPAVPHLPALVLHLLMFLSPPAQPTTGSHPRLAPGPAT